MELSEIGEKVFEVEAIVKQRVRKVTRVPMFLSIFVAMRVPIGSRINYRIPICNLFVFYTILRRVMEAYESTAYCDSLALILAYFVHFLITLLPTL